MPTMASPPDGCKVGQRQCLFEECTAIVQRLPRHLHQVHGLVPDSKEYRQAFEMSREVQGTAVQPATHSSDTTQSGAGFEEIPPLPTEDGATVSQNEREACRLDLATTAPTFLQHQSTLMGGSRELRAADQHVTQTMKLIECASPVYLTCSRSFRRCEHVLTHGTTLRNAIEGLRVRDCNGSRRAPGTLASYLGSFKQYLDFLAVCYAARLEKQGLDEAMLIVRSAQKTVQKLKAKRKVELQAKVSKELLTRDDTYRFLNSGARKRALRLLRDPAAKMGERRSVYIRNFLLAEMVLQSAHRSGVMSLMTLGEVRSAATVVRKSCRVTFVVSVLRHKTCLTHGPAQVPLTERLYKDLNTYIDRARPPGCSSADESRIFVTGKGAPLSSADISQGINSAFKRSGCRQARVNATLVRKTAATKCFEEKPGLVEEMAALMAHTVPVHRTYYRHVANADQSARTGECLRRLMGVVESGADEEPASACDDALVDDEAAEKWSERPAVLAPQVLPEEKGQVPLVEPSGSLFQQEGVTGPAGPRHHGRHALTPQERSELTSVYSDGLREGKVTLTLVREGAKTDERIRSLVDRHGELTVYESLRCIKARLTSE